MNIATLIHPSKEGQHNTGLDLTNPDAAQSVAGAPLCLLSGLAAQAHVRRICTRASRSKKPTEPHT